jgi:hypothetical protein
VSRDCFSSFGREAWKDADQERSMPQRYVLLRDSKAEPEVKAGTTVYAFGLSDYGCAETDARAIGRPCLSVTLYPDGGYPFFVVPLDDLRVVDG